MESKCRIIVLASSSPRRRDLLQEAGYEFEVVGPAIPEPDEVFHCLTPAQQAEALAYFKAREVQDTHPDRCILGADTIVAVGQRVLGKPADRDDAARMLEMLSGTRHQVITGVAILTPTGQRLIASESTWIRMRPMSRDEMDAYLDSGEWRGKAGAYAIQETADRFIEAVEGSFSNVVGLPLELVDRMVGELHVRPEAHKVF